MTSSIWLASETPASAGTFRHGSIERSDEINDNSSNFANDFDENSIHYHPSWCRGDWSQFLLQMRVLFVFLFHPRDTLDSHWIFLRSIPGLCLHPAMSRVKYSLIRNHHHRGAITIGLTQTFLNHDRLVVVEIWWWWWPPKSVTLASRCPFPVETVGEGRQPYAGSSTTRLPSHDQPTLPVTDSRPAARLIAELAGAQRRPPPRQLHRDISQRCPWASREDVRRDFFLDEHFSRWRWWVIHRLIRLWLIRHALDFRFDFTLLRLINASQRRWFLLDSWPFDASQEYHDDLAFYSRPPAEFRTISFCIGDDFCFTTFHEGRAELVVPEVKATDNFSHKSKGLKSRCVWPSIPNFFHCRELFSTKSVWVLTAWPQKLWNSICCWSKRSKTLSLMLSESSHAVFFWVTFLTFSYEPQTLASLLLCVYVSSVFGVFSMGWEQQDYPARTWHLSLRDCRRESIRISSWCPDISSRSRRYSLWSWLEKM